MEKSLKVSLICAAIAFIVLLAGAIYLDKKMNEPQIVFTYEMPIDYAHHCRYNIWGNNSGFSLIFSLNSTDCEPEKFKNRCRIAGGWVEVNELYIDEFPNATRSFTESTAEQKIGKNHVQCRIETKEIK